MKTVIIGGGGFVGQYLSARLLATDGDLSELVLVDQIALPPANDGRVTAVSGNFADPALLETYVKGANTVYLLASILGGAAEANYPLARRINVDASLSLIEFLRDSNPNTRLVFASTIAVYSKPMPDVVTDETPLGPTMVYGAQKLMLETAISNFAVRGWLDGVSLRLSGVMARDGADARLKSAFMSRVFYAVMRGEDIVLPVHPDSKTWLTSVDAAAVNFAHGGMISAELLGQKRAFTLPALHVSFAELVDALFRRFPTSSSKVTFEPDAELVGLFGSYPQLRTDIASGLGFKADADADDLVRRSI
ncbi:NAD-dependent epimerase/dehydratase family protein [Rhizobium sp.]|jgi:D-erythronate 2-dehydrogenase|uniref:NAD-dependent epimerase/dehydratase family protein n=1 Tax=Rhizobium sp. TaxID=391 RepID=UPI000E85FEBB|nr:UDP-glucose 4-epimerase [Rhizobium sp.]